MASTISLGSSWNESQRSPRSRVGSVLIQHYDYLTRAALHAVPPDLRNRVDVSGVVQNVCKLALQKSHLLRNLSRPVILAWVSAILKYQVCGIIRAARNEPRLVPLADDASSGVLASPPTIDLAPSPSSCAILGEQGDAVRQAIDRLPTRQREVVLLRYYERLSFRQVAELVGGDENRVECTHRRALANLQTMLGPGFELHR